MAGRGSSSLEMVCRGSSGLEVAGRCSGSLQKMALEVNFNLWSQKGLVQKWFEQNLEMVSRCVGDEDASVGSSQTGGEDLVLVLIVVLVLILV